MAGLYFGCILLYNNLEDSVKRIADVYSDLGVMFETLGMVLHEIHQKRFGGVEKCNFKSGRKYEKDINCS